MPSKKFFASDFTFLPNVSNGADKADLGNSKSKEAKPSQTAESVLNQLSGEIDLDSVPAVNLPEGPMLDSWSDVDPLVTEITHAHGCGCSQCSMPDESETVGNSDDTTGTVTGSSTASAPALLGDMADFLVQGYWTPARSHNLGDTGIDPNNGVLYYTVSANQFDADGITEDRAFLVREAFKLLEATLGIDFQETTLDDTNVVDFFFQDDESGAFAGSPYYSSTGEIAYSYINVAQSWSGGTSTYDDYTLQTIFHEIGHALGLGHQGPYNGSATYGVDNQFENDSWQASMMSYFSQTQNTTINASYEFLQTPMAVDWIALDTLYGTQGFGTFNAFTENTTWGFNTTVTSEVSDIWAQWSSYANRTASTIVDGGGIDTLDLSGYSNNTVINLAPSDSGSTAPSLSDIGGRIGNLAIAEGTIIENAIGGAGSETFYGNAADNTFTGNGGDDTFHDSVGNDTYYGNAGSDTVVFANTFASFTFAMSGSFLQVINVAVDLVDATIEWLDFSGTVYSWQEIVDGIGTGNTAPTANADSDTILEDGVSTGNLLSNDSDADGDTLSISAVNGQSANVGVAITLASGASLTVNSDGSYVYDPNGAFDSLNTGESANDTFTYTITDGNGGSDTATVTMTVDGFSVPNDPPSAVADSATVAEDATGTGNLLANDSDPDGDALSVSAVNGQSANVGATIALASGALLTVNANGSYDYDPNGAFDSLSNSETAADSFTYTVSDGNGGFDTATVSITIDGVSSVPVAGSDSDTVAESGMTSGNVLTNDTDGDGDSLSVVAVNGQGADVGQQVSLGSGALLTLNADGSYDYDPNGAFNSLADGESATDSFTYTVSDGKGGTDTATVTITINGEDPAPVETPVTVDFEGEPLGAFAGVDNVDASGLTVVSGGALNGSQYAQSDGFTLSTTGEDFDLDSITMSSAGGRVRVRIEAYDDGVLVGTATVNTRSNRTSDVNFGIEFDSVDEVVFSSNGTFNVDDISMVTRLAPGPGGNLSPNAVADNVSTNEDQATNLNVLANDSDPDGDPITLVSINGDSSGSVTLGSGAMVTFGTDGSVNYDPNGAFDALYDGQSATDSFTYLIADGQGGTDTATATITINGVGTPPPPPPEPTGYDIGFEGAAVAGTLEEDGFIFNDIAITTAALGVSSGSQAGESIGNSMTIVRSDGENFDFERAVVTAQSGKNVQLIVQAYDDGVLIGTDTIRIRDNRETTINFDDALFDSVDEVVLTANNGFIIDDMFALA